MGFGRGGIEVGEDGECGGAVVVLFWCIEAGLGAETGRVDSPRMTHSLGVLHKANATGEELDTKLKGQKNPMHQGMDWVSGGVGGDMCGSWHTKLSLKSSFPSIEEIHMRRCKWECHSLARFGWSIAGWRRISR